MPVICSISNGSGKLVRGLGLDRKNCFVQSQTHHRTQPTASWEGKLIHVPVNPQVLCYGGVLDPNN